MTHLLVSVSLESSQGEYRAVVWCHEALTDRRTLVEQLWLLESSEIAGFGERLKLVDTRYYAH